MTPTEAAATALENFATWIDGGTPRAWGWEHPCHPGERMIPTEAERVSMMIADAAREHAALCREKGIE